MCIYVFFMYAHICVYVKINFVILGWPIHHTEIAFVTLPLNCSITFEEAIGAVRKSVRDCKNWLLLTVTSAIKMCMFTGTFWTARSPPLTRETLRPLLNAPFIGCYKSQAPNSMLASMWVPQQVQIVDKITLKDNSKLSLCTIGEITVQLVERTGVATVQPTAVMCGCVTKWHDFECGHVSVGWLWLLCHRHPSHTYTHTYP